MAPPSISAEPASERLNRVMERIQKAAQRSGHDPQDITLVAVTKSVAFEQITPFLQAGVRHLGENRVQEAFSKYTVTDGSRRISPQTQLHLIGHLQSNKAKKAVGLFDMIQSVDSIGLAEDLNRHASQFGKTLDCLVEIKVSPEPAKLGLPPEELDAFLAQTASWPALRVKGLMGVAPYLESPEETRPYFAHLRRLFDKSGLDILSMGMSDDFEVAIEEGSTMVRLGTALFGTRPSIDPFSPGGRRQG